MSKTGETSEEWLTRERVAIGITVSLAVFATYLLLTDQIKSGPYVSMLALAGLTGVVIALWGNFTELSVFGSSVKLRQITHDAEDRIKKLDASCVNLYRAALLMAMRHPGALGGGFSDNRVRDYLAVVNAVEEAGVLEPLSDVIYRDTNTLISKQDERLRTFNHQTTGFSLTEATPEMTPQKFRVWLSEDGLPYEGDHEVSKAREASDHLQRLLEIRDKADTMRKKKIPDASSESVG